VSGNRRGEAFTEVQPGGVWSSENTLVWWPTLFDMGKAIVMSNDHGEFDKACTESETTCTVGNFPHGSRETPATSGSLMEADRSEKARGHNPDMHVTGESHSFIVPKKPANKGRVPGPAESGEGRELTKENTEQSLLDRTQSRRADGRPFVARSRGLLGVREAVRFARQHPR
jgi:hypothetical protein